jgi:hypothetical protein
MFNSSRGISKATQKQLSRSRQRRLSFECFETRSMLSAAPTQLDPELLIAVSGQLANLHIERPVAHTESFQGNSYAFLSSPSEGGFLETSANVVVNFHSTSSTTVFGSTEWLSTISPSSITTYSSSSSGITLNFDAAGTGLTSKFNDITPLVTPTPIIVFDSYNESKQADSPSALAESASPGGAIRMEPITKSPVDGRVGGPISVPPQQVEVGESQINRLTISTLVTTQSSPISGEWARAVVFEMAGGEPLLARKSTVSADVKLSTGLPSDESPKPHTLSRAEIPTSLDAETQEAAATADDTAVAKQANLSDGPHPYSAAISAAVDVFMANWNSARADRSIFEGPVLRTTPAPKAHPQTKSAGAKPTAPKGDEQAADRIDSESGIHHAGMEAAPVLIALALERWLHRRTSNEKSKAGTIGIGG